jgi:hypothetical protein
MNVVTTTWRQLVRRRLWPVAVLLVAALAAVPVLLAREPELPAPPTDPVPVVSEADDTIAEPVVAKVTAQDRDRRRRVLGAAKDPFEPAPPAKKAKKAKTDTPKPKADAGSPEPKVSTPGATGQGSPPISVGGGGIVTPVEPAPKKKYYEAGTIIVRFGDATQEQLDRFVVKKLGPVPDDELPLLVYMGLTKNGKKARFLVDAAVEPDGDGDCKPHPASCETIELSVGETEFLDVIDPEAAEDATDEARILAQYQLDIVDIKRAGDDDVK